PPIGGCRRGCRSPAAPPPAPGRRRCEPIAENRSSEPSVDEQLARELVGEAGIEEREREDGDRDQREDELPFARRVPAIERRRPFSWLVGEKGHTQNQRQQENERAHQPPLGRANSVQPSD